MSTRRRMEVLRRPENKGGTGSAGGDGKIGTEKQPDLKTVQRNLNEKYAGKVVTFKGGGRQYYLGKDGSLHRLDGKRRRTETATGPQPRDTRSPRQKRRERKRRAR